MDKTVLYKSLPIHYRDTGEGFPVLLIHGMAEDGAIWDAQVPALTQSSAAKNCRLIVPDLPGSGQSPLLPEAPSIDELAEAIKELCDQARLEQCILIGHSMGGYVALAFAERYPHRLKAFGLFHSTAYPDSEEKKANRRKAIDFIRKNGSAAYIRQSVPNLLSENTRKERPEIMNGLIDKYSGFRPESLIWYHEAMIGRPDRVSILQHFTGPVLFLIGEQDRSAPPEDSLRQCHLPALSQVQIFRDTAHNGMLEESRQSSQALQSFINLTLRS